MRHYFLSIFLCVLFSLEIWGIEKTHLSYSDTIDISNLKLVPIEIDGVAYTEISIEGIENTGLPGAPLLPVFYYDFSVPACATDLNVDIIIHKKTTLELHSSPYPAQKPGRAGKDSKTENFIHLIENNTKCDTVKHPEYEKGIYNIGGFNKICNVAFHPIAWNKEDNTIEIAEKFDIQLKWNLSSSEAESLIIPKFEDIIVQSFQEVKKVVVNPNDVESNFTSLSKYKNMVVHSSSTEEYIPYIIITTKEIMPILERLAAFRRLRGYQTRIYDIEEILSDPQFKDGDTLSHINDDAGKLRAFLTQAYQNNGSQYILLAGAYPNIPGRWGFYKGEGDFVFDLYYRDITTKWKLNQDSSIDCLSLPTISYDLKVGRINTNSPTDYKNYVDKLVQYEFNIHNVDMSYLNKAFILCGHDQLITQNYDLYAQDTFVDHFDYIKEIKIPENTHYPGAQAIQEMNTSYWGYIDWRCHGNYVGVGTSNINGIYGINALDEFSGDFIPEPKNGLNNWNNKDRYCWSLSMACNTSEIGIQYKEKSFAESFLLGKNYGGIGYIGNSGPGLIVQSSFLLKYIFQESLNLSKSHTHLPIISDLLNSGSLTCPLNDWYYKYVKSVIGLSGDPLAIVWLREPHKNTKGKYKLAPELTVNDSIISGKYNFINRYAEKTSTVMGKSYQNYETVNHTLSHSRSDLIPYIYPTWIKNLEVDKDGYWFTGKLRIGEASKLISPTFILKSGVKLSIEALDTVDINGNISLAKTCDLRLFLYKKTSFKNCNLFNGGSISIDTSGIVEIGKNTEIKKGTTITISNSNKYEN